MSLLFTPAKFRELEIRNRIFVSPMCQYSAQDGVPNNWHLVHLGSRAVGGAGLILVEATGVSPEARISPGDLGIWSDEQASAFKPITTFIKEHGARAGVQLAHAGRKASTSVPWQGGGRPLRKDEGAWQTLAPSAVPFDEGWHTPKEMSVDDIQMVIRQFRQAAERALTAGFEVVEVHAAHGYLLHEFLSPLSNHRLDNYGGSLESRMRLVLEVCSEVRQVWPEKWPVFVRISSSDWAEGGWDLEQSLVLCSALKKLGIDLIDCSSGGLVPQARIPVGPGYQAHFAAEIRRRAKIATGAVGLITEARQAEMILFQEQADVVFLAREFLRDPYWPLHTAQQLGVPVEWPKQYERVQPRTRRG